MFDLFFHPKTNAQLKGQIHPRAAGPRICWACTKERVRLWKQERAAWLKTVAKGTKGGPEMPNPTGFTKRRDLIDHLVSRHGFSIQDARNEAV